MSLKLVKTTGGSNGSPTSCNSCGQKNFIRSGIAWHCSNCGIYYPTSLGFESLKRNLEHLGSLKKDFKKAIDDLERIIKE